MITAAEGDPHDHVINVAHDSNGVVFLDGQAGGLAVLPEAPYGVKFLLADRNAGQGLPGQPETASPTVSGRHAGMTGPLRAERVRPGLVWLRSAETAADTGLRATVHAMPAIAGRPNVIVVSVADDLADEQVIGQVRAQIHALSARELAQTQVVFTSAPSAGLLEWARRRAGKSGVPVVYPHGQVRPGPGGVLVADSWGLLPPGATQPRPLGLVYPSPDWELGLATPTGRQCFRRPAGRGGGTAGPDGDRDA